MSALGQKRTSRIETVSGDFNAYQSKFRSGRPSLRWDELATFFGLSDQVTQRVLFTNCDELPSVANERTGFYCIRGNDLDRLERRDFVAIQQWLETGVVVAERKEPLPHQTEALSDILDEFKLHDRATAIMASGTGKTLVELWTAEQMGCNTVLVLVPSLALLRQTLHEWLKETSWPLLAYLCVCSDPTVEKRRDELIVRQSDLDFPVSTNSDTVQRFLSTKFAGTKVVFSTYQSAQVVAEAMKGQQRLCGTAKARFVSILDVKRVVASTVTRDQYPRLSSLKGSRYRLLTWPTRAWSNGTASG